MNIWITADTHLGHDKLLELEEGLAPDFQERILRGLQRMSASKEDLFIHLGDVSVGNDQVNHERLLSALPFQVFRPRAVLVRGNHDCRGYSWYYARGWDFVCDRFELLRYGKRLIFSHRPVPEEGVYADTYVIHGHCHNVERESVPLGNLLYSQQAFNYQPVTLKAFLRRGLKRIE